MPKFVRRNKSLQNTFFVQFGWRPVQGPVWHFGVRRDVLFRKDTMFCFAKTQCLFRKDTMFCSAKTQCLFRKDTMSVPQRHNVCFAKTQCSVSRRHNVLFRNYTMFCFATAQCSVSRRHNVQIFFGGGGWVVKLINYFFGISFSLNLFAFRAWPL